MHQALLTSFHILTVLEETRNSKLVLLKSSNSAQRAIKALKETNEPQNHLLGIPVFTSFEVQITYSIAIQIQ